METTIPDFVYAAGLEELKAKARLVVHGRHRPILLLYEDGQVFALDNRCPHMAFRSNAAASMTASSPAIGIMRASS